MFLDRTDPFQEQKTKYAETHGISQKPREIKINGKLSEGKLLQNNLNIRKILENARKKTISRGIKLRPRSLEQKLADNLRELTENPEAEILPITEGYLAAQESDGALAEFLRKQKKPNPDD